MPVPLPIDPPLSPRELRTTQWRDANWRARAGGTNPLLLLQLTATMNSEKMLLNMQQGKAACLHERWV